MSQMAPSSLAPATFRPVETWFCVDSSAWLVASSDCSAISALVLVLMLFSDISVPSRSEAPDRRFDVGGANLLRRVRKPRTSSGRR